MTSNQPEQPPVWFDLFGHVLELRCPSAAIIDQLIQRESCWKPLAREQQPWSATELDRAVLFDASSDRDASDRDASDPDGSRVDVLVEVLIHPPPSPLTEIQHFSNDHFFFHGSSSRLLTGYLYARPWQVHVQSYVEDDETTLDNMILPVLNTVLLRLGLVNVHCAAVSRQGKGLLLIGPSQSGKSTTSLLLARAGFDFVSDNDVYLQQAGDSVAALSSSKELFLLDDTAERFGDLKYTVDLPVRVRGNTPKRVVAMDELMPEQCVQRTLASTVVFPQVGHSAETQIEPMDSFDCLQRLMELVPARGLPALIKDQKALARLFDLLSTLSATTKAYRVRLGSDPERLVSTIGQLL